MKNNFRNFSLLIVFSLLITIFNESSSSAAYPGPPSDLAALKSKISESLVQTNWFNRKGVGFAGNYNISQDQKDSGINSIIVTPFSAISQDFNIAQSCFSSNFNTDVTLDYNSKKYKATCSAYSSGGIDMAALKTSLNLPTLNLFDSYIPSVGEWLLAVYYVEGFGIVFATTKIKLVNMANLILAIDKFEPMPTTGALLFNSLGNFVGVTTTNGPGTVPNEYLKVQGAPLQCQVKGQTKGSITLCPSSQESVWVTSNPGEPPVPEVADPLQEAIDANQAFTESFSALKTSVDTCNLTLNISDTAIKSEIRHLAFNSSCDYLLTKGNTVVTKTLRIPTISKSSTQAEINNVVDLWNSMTDEMNALCEEADTYNASAQDAIDSIEKVLELERNSVSISGFIQGNFKKLNNQVALLPPKDKAKITNSDEYLDLKLSISQYYKIKSYIADFRNGRYDILEAERLINELEANFSLDSINYDYEYIQDSIPKYVCIKGKSILNFNSKCQIGYTKKLLK